MKVARKGIELIRSFEKFNGHLYHTDGGGHCTIGWGHLVHPGHCDGRENEKKFKAGVNHQVASQLLESDLAGAEATINQTAQKYKIQLNQNQFDALVSFTFNTGAGSFKKMILQILRENAGVPIDEIPRHMIRYNRSSGKVLLGLERRRNAEIRLFNGAAVQ
ncbi:lysozyme [Limnobacter sp.]|uniref:lysozyme n=1 Tax=Limnobacter sp. TaxID=2003368 RepID=UPI00258E5CE2|nr:lysozyme [Limnobacter sp.]